MLIIAFLYPGIVFGILFDLKLIMWSYHSAPAILFTTLLALLLSFQHFDMYLDSTVLPIKIFRDYISLGFINWTKNNNQRLLQWSLDLQEYNLEIEHVKGKENIMADTLSQVTYSDIWTLFTVRFWFF